MLFASTDDGRSFTAPPNERPASTQHGRPGGGALRLSETMVVTGMEPAEKWATVTRDGGVHWSESNIQGLPPGTHTDIMRLWQMHGRVEMLVEVFSEGNVTSTFRVFASDDGARTFHPVGTDVTDLAPPVVAGASLWSLAKGGGSLRVSQDGGATWATIDAPTLPPALSLAFTSDKSATALVGSGGCVSFKQDCWSRSVLYATTDGGHTWSPLPLPPGV